jgi:hypothetical protein
MTGTEAFNHLCRYIRDDMLPSAQLHYLINVVRLELAAPKATDQLELIARNNSLTERITTLELLLNAQEQRLDNLLPVDSPSRRGRKRNDQTP